MTEFLGFVALVVVLFTVTFAYEKLITQPKLRKMAEAAPRITMSEIDTFWKKIDDASLPIAKIITEDREPNHPHESRFGGAPLALVEQWPESESEGTPLLFLAQINFGDMPEMDGFPDRGILQIFTLPEVEDEEHFIWEPNPQTDQLMAIPEEVLENKMYKSWFRKGVLSAGLPFTFTTDVARGNPYNEPFLDMGPFFENRLPENDAVAAKLEEYEAECESITEGYGAHWVGGQPAFIQDDVRSEAAREDPVDRVILHMGFDKHICIGDAGRLNVFLSHDALARRDFKKSQLMWDCG